MNQSVRCPECRDLFAAENGGLPTHYLDTFEGAPKCEGSGLVVTRQ